MSLLLALLLSQTLVSSPAAQAKQKDAIRIQIGGEPSSLDPWRAVDVYGFGILRNVQEGLFKLGPDGELENGLAASHEISKDGLKYKFKLRPNARWSDGVAVTADHIVTGLRHTLNPKTAAPNAEYFFAIKNAREVFAGKLPLETLGVRREGDDVVIELMKADPLLLLELTLPAASPLRPEILTASKGRWDHTHPVTGDYKIISYRPSDEVLLAPNPHASSPGKKPITYKILSEEITAMNLFESGRMDVVSTVTLSEIERLKKEGLVKTFPSATTFYVSFNLSKAPFNDLDWRKAVAAAIDREGLARALHGGYEPATSYLPKSIAGTLPYKPLVDEAAVAKIRSLAKKPRIRFAYGNSGPGKIVAEKVQSDLFRKLGLRIEIEPMELKTLLGRLQSDPPEMYYLGMSATFNDPVAQLNSFTNESTPPHNRYKSEVYEKLLADFKATPVGPRRAELAREANRQLIEADVAIVPLLLRLQVFGVSKSLKGFRVSPYQIIDLGALEK